MRKICQSLNALREYVNTHKIEISIEFHVNEERVILIVRDKEISYDSDER